MGTLTKIKHKIVIAGNHDTVLDPKTKEQFATPFATKAEVRKEFTNCVYLEDQSVKVLGLKIYGSPW